MTAFLGVETSISGRKWVGPTPEEDRLAEAMAQETTLSTTVARILARRGVAPADAESFLAPTLRDLLPDPMRLRDMGPAADRFLSAVKAHERIAIFADYDVDGGASAALLINWLRMVGITPTLYIPDRIDEGYGPNVPAMQELGTQHDLIICVDCGTLSHDPIAAAKCDVLVLDHHLGSETLPPAVAVVNPNRQDEDGTLGHLCAAGVVFLLLVEANRRQRETGAQGPDLIALLDLVALATVADVAPLIGINRAFVRQGLTVMAGRNRPGLVALSDIARLDRPPTAYHLGFLMGPRVNAGGRVGAADLGARLLATADPHEAAALAQRLDDLNGERRAIEATVLAAATEQVESRPTDGALVWAAGEGWHPGVVGIVASRLKEAYHRPAIVIGLENSEGKGSGRSVEGVDLGASVQRLVGEGLLTKGGGHKMAAGLSLDAASLIPAMERLEALLARQGATPQGPRDLRLDGILMPGAITPELVDQIEAAGPFGAAAPAPRFALPDVSIRHTRRVGESHLKLSIATEGGKTLNAIAFRAYEGPLGPALESQKDMPVHLAGKLELNHWQGRTSAELRLDDAAIR